MALYISDANGQLKKVAGNQRTVNLSDVYPVGSIYLSIDSTSPAGLFGGSWTQIPANYALWTATSGAGNTISAGLPNISGAFKIAGGSGGLDDFSGAFYSYSSHNNAFSPTSGSGNKAGFQASRSNPIYGNSTTVQPPAYKVYAWRRIS